MLRETHTLQYNIINERDCLMFEWNEQRGTLLLYYYYAAERDKQNVAKFY